MIFFIDVKLHLNISQQRAPVSVVNTKSKHNNIQHLIEKIYITHNKVMFSLYQNTQLSEILV